MFHQLHVEWPTDIHIHELNTNNIRDSYREYVPTGTARIENGSHYHYTKKRLIHDSKTPVVLLKYISMQIRSDIQNAIDSAKSASLIL